MCNGWTNRETWLVNLWFRDHFQMELEDGVEITADYIRETVEQYVEHKIGDWSDFIIDMMNLNAINYNELASHYESEPEVVEG